MDTGLLYWCRLFNTQCNEASKQYNNNLVKSIFKALPNHKLLQTHITECYCPWMHWHTNAGNVLFWSRCSHRLWLSTLEKDIQSLDKVTARAAAKARTLALFLIQSESYKLTHEALRHLPESPWWPSGWVEGSHTGTISHGISLYI